MRRRIGQFAAAVVLPGVAEILRGRVWIGAAGALAYCACWQVMLIGFWLLPEQFPAAVPILAACGGGGIWLGGLGWTALAMVRRPVEQTHGEQMDRDLRTAVALILQGAYGRAEEKLRAVLRRQRDCVAAWAHLGWLYHLKGARRPALRAYRRALWLDEEGRFEADLRRELALILASSADRSA